MVALELGEGKLPHPLTKQQDLEIQSALPNHHRAYLMLEQWLLSHWNSSFFYELMRKFKSP